MSFFPDRIAVFLVFLLINNLILGQVLVQFQISVQNHLEVPNLFLELNYFHLFEPRLKEYRALFFCQSNHNMNKPDVRCFLMEAQDFLHIEHKFQDALKIP
jgi:hypothetical protein